MGREQQELGKHRQELRLPASIELFQGPVDDGKWNLRGNAMGGSHLGPPERLRRGASADRIPGRGEKNAFARAPGAKSQADLASLPSRPRGRASTPGESRASHPQAGRWPPPRRVAALDTRSAGPCQTPGATDSAPARCAPEQGHNKRGSVVGRKNHYGSKSLRGTQVAATFYTLIETAGRHGLDPRAYLLHAAQHALNNPGSARLPWQMPRP